MQLNLKLEAIKPQLTTERKNLEKLLAARLKWIDTQRGQEHSKISPGLVKKLQLEEAFCDQLRGYLEVSDLFISELLSFMADGYRSQQDWLTKKANLFNLIDELTTNVERKQEA